MIFRVGHNRGFLGRDNRGPYAANRHPFHTPVGVISPGGLGFMSDYGDWNSVFDAYLCDDLPLAQQLSEPLGVGTQGEYVPFITVLNTEAELGSASEIHGIGENLELEVAEG